MDPKKGRRLRKIEVSIDSAPEFDLGTLRQIYSGGGRGLRQGKGRKRHRNRGRRSGGRKLGITRGGSVRKVCKNRQK